MKTQWYKVTVEYADKPWKGYALEARDEIAALSTVLGWMRTARQAGKPMGTPHRLSVTECAQPSSIDEAGHQTYLAPNPFPPNVEA